MCQDHAEGEREIVRQVEVEPGYATRLLDLNDLPGHGRFLAGEPEVRRSAPGFIGYGGTRSGDRVLIAVDSLYDPRVPEAIARALREAGARVDLITIDAGADREFGESDEIAAMMRREPFARNPRRWDYVPWITELGTRNRYDLVIHGKGSPVPKTPFRYEAIPWLQIDHFTQRATTFPRALHTRINELIWREIWDHGRGGRMHLTDPEGTDLSWTLHPSYYDGAGQFNPRPLWGHLLAHGTSPIPQDEDATGIVCGTTSHFCRPFPQLRAHVEAGRIVRLDGGGGYGNAWRGLMEESERTQYPDFPLPGLFWLQEVAIGTNPKIARPRSIHLHSSGGGEWERRRSGVIHMGFGTFWQAAEEDWAAEHGILYGHLHIHLLFPTLDLTTKGGEVIRLIDRGRLTVLDDPEIRALAGRFGDPEFWLTEDWIPLIPGITAPGSYEEYALDPAPWVYGERQTAH